MNESDRDIFLEGQHAMPRGPSFSEHYFCGMFVCLTRDYIDKTDSEPNVCNINPVTLAF